MISIPGPEEKAKKREREEEEEENVIVGKEDPGTENTTGRPPPTL